MAYQGSEHINRTHWPHSHAGSERKIGTDILPLLSRQKGFQAEITFANPDSRDAPAAGPWDSKEIAEACDRPACADVSKPLSMLAGGTPRD